MTPPIRKGDGTGLSVKGFSEVRKGDGTILWSAGGDVPNDVTHFWRADDGSGSTVTDSVGSADGTINGNVEWTASGAFSGESGLEFFNDDTSYVSVPVNDAVPSDGDFTIIGAFRAPETADGDSIIGNNDGQAGRWNLDVFDGSDSARFFSDNGPTLSASADYHSGAYHTLAVRREGDNWDLLADANVVDSATNSGTLDSGTVDYEIGRIPSGINEMDGILDAIAIADAALSDAEIEAFPWEPAKPTAFRITDNSQYNNEPHIFELNNGDLFVLYRADGSHGTTDDHKLAGRKSTDGGDSWGSEIVVEDPTAGTGNPNAFYVEADDRLVAQYRELGSSGDDNTYQIDSTDGGETWSSRTEITAFSIDPAVTFGQAVETSQGWMLLGYDGSGRVEAAFSSDGTTPWGSVVSVVDTSGTTDRTLTEPVALTVDNDQIIVFGRESDQAEFWAVKSDDGGQTWGSVEYFDLRSNVDTPLYIRPTDASTATAMWGSRDTAAGEMFYATASLTDLWADPTALANADEKSIFDGTASEDIDFGYPTFTTVGGRVFSTWYDEDNPNIWGSFLER